jgi:hypothetical protein
MHLDIEFIKTFGLDEETTKELIATYVISLQRLLPDAIAETKKHLLYDSRNL